MLGEEVARDINEFTAMSHRVAREITRLEQELLPTVNPALRDPEGKA
jgi:hypothetical protein